MCGCPEPLRPALGVRNMRAVKFTNSHCECSLGGHCGFPSAEKKIEYLGGEIDSRVADRARTMTMMMSRIVAALRLIDPATQPHINIR